MKVEKVKEIEFCKYQFAYIADPDKVDEKIDEAIFSLKKARIPGFRPGKAPDNVIKNKCKNEIKKWVQREMIIQAYDDIIFEAKVKPLGQPTVDESSLNDNKFECKMTVVVRPEFELSEIVGMELPEPHVANDSLEQKEKALYELRMQMGDVEPYGEGDFVDKGHQITMDVFATVDGEPFPDATAEGLMYTIGDNKIEGLDDNLIGMLPGEDREFDLAFGDKEIHFKVTVHMGMKKIPHELNDEFVQKLGVQSLEELEKTLTVMADNRIKEKRTALLKEQVVKRLALDNDFEAPNFLVEKEAEFICMRTGLDWGTVDEELKKTFVKQATDNVKLSIIIETIRDAKPETVLSDNEAMQGLRNTLISSGQNPDEYINTVTKNGSLLGLLGQMKHHFVLQWIIDNAKIIE